jgi:hypothetical protein
MFPRAIIKKLVVQEAKKTIPTGKLFGLRKFDLIQTPKGTGFVKGKRSSGYFAISDIHGKAIHNSVKVKADVIRISARNTTITIMENSILANRCSPQGFSIPPPPEGKGFLEKLDEQNPST